jgi:type I restriction enzyme S subunit
MRFVKLKLVKFGRKAMTKENFVPQGWREVKLGDALNCLTSNITDADINKVTGKTPVYGADGISGYLPSGRIGTDYISIVKDGAGVSRITLRRSNTSIAGTMNALTAKSSDIDIEYLFYYLSLFQFDKYVVGSTIPHIYFKDYSSAIIPLPPLPVQRHIAAQLTTVDEEIELIEKKIASLKEQRKWLLNNLVTGKVRLPGFVDSATNAQSDNMTDAQSCHSAVSTANSQSPKETK